MNKSLAVAASTVAGMGLIAGMVALITSGYVIETTNSGDQSTNISKGEIASLTAACQAQNLLTAKPPRLTVEIATSDAPALSKSVGLAEHIAMQVATVMGFGNGAFPVTVTYVSGSDIGKVAPLRSDLRISLTSGLAIRKDFDIVDAVQGLPHPYLGQAGADVLTLYTDKNSPMTQCLTSAARNARIPKLAESVLKLPGADAAALKESK